MPSTRPRRPISEARPMPAGPWSASRYDDGGFSGGSTERPALQRLLEDIRAGKIDVIVVYKVDRLTRSLADFAKLVELFDAHGVSFVSVTQQFNTTTSMGRLTLNVLLSFAQFEREVTSERIRDKIAASKRKGLWVGGMVPLGYDSQDRRSPSTRRGRAGPDDLPALSRARQPQPADGRPAQARHRHQGRELSRSGETVGGIPFTRGPLAYLLRNRFYIGEVVFKGEILPGEQPAILDRDLFEAVQAKLSEQVNNHNRLADQVRGAPDRPHLRRSRQSHEPEPCPKGRHQVPILHLVGPPAGPARASRSLSAGSRHTRSRRSSSRSVRKHLNEPTEIDDAALIRIMSSASRSNRTNS